MGFFSFLFSSGWRSDISQPSLSGCTVLVEAFPYTLLLPFLSPSAQTLFVLSRKLWLKDQPSPPFPPLFPSSASFPCPFFLLRYIPTSPPHPSEKRRLPDVPSLLPYDFPSRQFRVRPPTPPFRYLPLFCPGVEKYANPPSFSFSSFTPFSPPRKSNISLVKL